MERPSRSKRKAEVSPSARALRLLARRDHTRVELERKLAPHVQDAAELQALLDTFSARGWLSEQRVVDQLLHAKRSRLGTARIRQALIEKGVSQDLIGPALESLRETELDAARSVWARKFRTVPRDAAECARQVRFLQSRGFSVEVAMRVVRSRDHDIGDS